MTADLAGFLLARIAEDEERAEAANGGRIAAQLYTSKNATADDIRFTEAWSPARVLAECEAKRRIADRHVQARADSTHSPDASQLVSEPLRTPFEHLYPPTRRPLATPRTDR